MPPLGANVHPVYGKERLLNHPVKGRKPQDLERIFNSENSEDWVTWNVVQLMHLVGPSVWWPALVHLAAQDNRSLEEHLLRDVRPEVEVWRNLSSPGDYEAASRARMTQSSDPRHVARSLNPKAVEGDSEIDLICEAESLLCLVEAKLGSDVSTRTTYDPERNQIARNIDCLLESARGRTPVFWMLVRDKGPGRTYTQLMRGYQQESDRLRTALPHRAPAEVEAVARNLALVRWSDLLDAIFPSVEQVARELSRRVASAT